MFPICNKVRVKLDEDCNKVRVYADTYTKGQNLYNYKRTHIKVGANL